MARRKGSKDKQPRKRSALATLGKGTLIGAGVGAGTLGGLYQIGLNSKGGQELKKNLVKEGRYGSAGFKNVSKSSLGLIASTNPKGAGAKHARKVLKGARTFVMAGGGIGGAIAGAGITGAGLGIAHLLRKRNKNKR